ncbi:hypothetical protein ENSA7_13400 [Enhygromyxa salina]|uniref:Uncharacterized protein n=1 Tax=Enhygromyxa salina TaxID=215803 RepID=A0A2S9YV11_9BACT|nr:hypothetical protein ENSA7_13400 [Enhygromyxa salina]
MQFSFRVLQFARSGDAIFEPGRDPASATVVERAAAAHSPVLWGWTAVGLVSRPIAW